MAARERATAGPERKDAPPPEEFVVEHLRRLKKEPRRPWSEVRRELGL